MSQNNFLLLRSAGDYIYFHVRKPGQRIPLETQQRMPGYVSISRKMLFFSWNKNLLVKKSEKSKEKAGKFSSFNNKLCPSYGYGDEFINPDAENCKIFVCLEFSVNFEFRFCAKVFVLNHFCQNNRVGITLTFIWHLAF